MRVSNIKESDLTPEIVDRLLFQGLKDTGENVDCLVVLGSIKAAKYRVPAAVEAYKAGRTGKIMLCGGKLRDFSTGKCSEAAYMYQAAVEAGVPAEDLILEDSSQNTVENILFSLIALQRTFQLNQVRSVMLVTTAYHMRRSLAAARYLYPKHISVLPCPVDDTNTRRDNWMNTLAGMERAKTEAMKIVEYVVNGVFPDFEI